MAGTNFINAVGSITSNFSNLQSSDVVYDMSKQSRSLSSMVGAEVRLFAEDMQKQINQMHPSVAQIFVDNAQNLLDGMRCANTETKAGYGGSTGSGSALYSTISWAYDFINPNIVGTTYRRNWIRAVAAASTVGTPTPFVTGTVVAVGTAVNLAMAEEEAMVFLGFTERADVEPLASAVQLVYNSDTYNYWNIPWEFIKRDGGAYEHLCVWELPQPVVIPPEQSIQINVRYDGIGTSYLTPIVVRYRRASDMRTL